MRNFLRIVLKKIRIILLVISNVLLIAGAVCLAVRYSGYIQGKQIHSDVDAFCATMESMKQIASNYMQMESRHVLAWAQYAETRKLTKEQALEYIREANAKPDCIAQIIETDPSFEFTQAIRINLEGTETESYLFGTYRISESSQEVISVGTFLTLKEGEGYNGNDLLLRTIPVESLADIWVFPEDYRAATVGIITDNGDYIIRAPGMEKNNWIEFLREYNRDADEAGAFEERKAQLTQETQGLWRYRNSEGQDCYWYYSKYKDNPHLCILGSIPADSFQTQDHTWQILLIICVVFALLLFLDGYYVLHINRQLRRNYVMAEQANDAKTRFLSAMSHDIRTPMNAIIGMTEIARQHVKEPDYVKECLAKVKIASSHLMTLINDILDVSKYESGKVSLHPGAFCLEQSVESTISLVRPDAEEKKLELQVEQGKLPYPYVIGDELRLQQIWMNLLSNAVKYTPVGGKVRFAIYEEEFREEEQEVEVTVLVSDNGRGITPEFQKVMYQAFAREADSRIDKNTGSGLGLAIVKQLVDLMSGTIDCKSAPGEGTTFTVRMHLKVSEQQNRPQEEEQTLPMEEPSDFAGMRILVAEDNDLNWKIIHIILKQYEVQSDRVRNGQECVDTVLEAAENTYDLILMDIQMPVMDGMEATRQIRNSGRSDLKNVLIYAMTADAYEEDIQACLDAGMSGHIAKPIEVEHVYAALCKAWKQGK